MPRNSPKKRPNLPRLLNPPMDPWRRDTGSWLHSADDSGEGDWPKDSCAKVFARGYKPDRRYPIGEPIVLPLRVR